MTVPVPVHDFSHVQPFVQNYKARISEGLTVNRQNDTLLWVDIAAGEVHRIFLHGDKHNRTYSNHETYKIPNEVIGVIYLTTDDDVILVGGRTGIASLELSTEEFNYIWKFDSLPEVLEGKEFKLRTNDGNLDPNGNIWQGIMFDVPYEASSDGKLLKLDTKTGEFTVQVKDVVVPNGISWSKNGKTVYWASTRDDAIYRFPFDLETSTIGEKQIHTTIKKYYEDEPCEGPDGHAITQDNHIFSAIWAGGSVAHFDENGDLVEKFKLPFINSCNCLFVDEDELFVCGANGFHENPDWTDDTLGGAIFRFVIEGGHKPIDRIHLQWPLKKD